ncbi:MAG: amylo-alpha-1,6-glucosidase, partial [Candidatus Aminicenantales bacterium]
TRPIKAQNIAENISVSPEATILTFAHQSFTIKAIYLTPLDQGGAVILLKVDSIEPLTIVCSFLPVLQPMWPAGLGGQYAYWNNKLKAYIISEPTGKNHGLIGSPAASGISYTPAHMLAEAPNEFKIEIKRPQDILNKYIPIYMAGGKGEQKDIIDIYQKLRANPEKFYQEKVAYFQDLRLKTLQIKTPEPDLNLAFEWAKVALYKLRVDNPDLGRGLVAGLGASGTSGRPGFAWFFGGDAFINGLSFLSFGALSTARQALAFTQKWQRADGKMAHELSQAAAYLDWWHDYHYGYIHADTTPYYLVAMDEYLKMSGDKDFIKKSWDSLKKAYQWCLSTDVNGDGLMDNSKAGLGALEYGALTGIETDIYLAAIWTRAALAMHNLAQSVREKSLAEKALSAYQKAKKAFNEKFWNEESKFYVYAFNQEGRQVKEISPWNALGLMWNFGQEDRTFSSLEKLSSSALTTDWGIRSLANNSQYYQPLGYNYGAVWPFISGWVAAAQFKNHFLQQGYLTLMSTAAHTFDNSLGSVDEVFSGSHNIWLEESVPNQGFSSAAVVYPLVRGLLGLEGDALRKIVFFNPYFPGDWEKVAIKNFQVQEAKFSFDYRRSKSSIKVFLQAQKGEDYRLYFAPALAVGSKIKSLVVDGQATPFKIKIFPQAVQAKAEISLNKKSINIEMKFKPTVEVLPPKVITRTGERNRGLKIISIKRGKNKELLIKVEGLAGEKYELNILNPELVKKANGANLEENRLKIQMPAGQPKTFIPHTIIIKVS